MIDFNQEDKGKVALDIVENFSTINLKEVESYVLGLEDADFIFVSRILNWCLGQSGMIKIDSEEKIFQRITNLRSIKSKTFFSQGVTKYEEFLRSTKGVKVG